MSETSPCTSHAAPAVSVVIPAYNAERHLGEALSSVLAQTFGDYEIIVVNDGSTDKTGDILDAFIRQESRIIRIDQPNSGKPSIARNRGIAACRAECIAFLDADDVWLPRKLEESLAALADTDADLCYHDFCWMGGHGDRSSQSRWGELNFLENAAPHLDKCGAHYIARPSFLGFVVSTTPAIQTSSVVLRKSVLCGDTWKFPEDMTIGEDLDLWFRLFYKCRTALLNQALFVYRKHGTNITADQVQLFLGMIEVREKVLERRHAIPSKIRRSIQYRIADLYRDVAYLCRMEGNFDSARKYYWRSFRLKPEFRKVASILRSLLRWQ